MPPRLLIACPQCRRQFSVTGRMVGSRFHCHCGTAVEVAAARGHDASVVVCTSCGAPRLEGAKACGHCNSDFTLHEQDLDTACPGCLARISRRAKFCHHCGLRIAVEPIRKRSSAYLCAACVGEKHLAHREMGEQHLAVLECQQCAGLWIPMERFHALIEEEARRERAPLGPRAEWKEQTGRMYRPCVVCRQLMVRQNFGRGKSRVIVDLCGQHGVWFDNDELAHLLAWVRAVGPRDARLDIAKLSGSKDRALKRQAHRLEENPSPFAGEYRDPEEGYWIYNWRLSRMLDRLFPGLFDVA